MSMKKANDVFIYTDCFQTAGKEKIRSLNCNNVRWQDNSMKDALANSTIVAISNINDNVTTMEGCFKSASNFKNITSFPSSITNLKNCFNGCSSLESIPEIPNTVTNVEGCFASTKIVNIPTLPSAITSLKETFMNTSIVTLNKLPSSITNLNSTFTGSSILTTVSIHIPETVTNMDKTFDACIKLTGDIYIDSKNITSSSASTLQTFGNTTLDKDVYIYFYDDNYNETNTYKTFTQMGYNDTTRVNGVLLKDRSECKGKLDVTDWKWAYNPTNSRDVDLQHYIGDSDFVIVPVIEEQEGSYAEVDTDKWEYEVKTVEGKETLRLLRYKDNTDETVNVPYLISEEE